MRKRKYTERGEYEFKKHSVGKSEERCRLQSNKTAIKDIKT